MKRPEGQSEQGLTPSETMSETQGKRKRQVVDQNMEQTPKFGAADAIKEKVAASPKRRKMEVIVLAKKQRLR